MSGLHAKTQRRQVTQKMQMIYKAYLLDIEGTTTPIDFVFNTLFPYARKKMADFLGTQPTQDLETLSAEYEKEANPPAWLGRPSALGALDYLYWLMNQDRKSPALK